MGNSQKMIDLRSDSSSTPTQEMIESIRQARLGNDGFGEDPTVNELQSLAARMLGKEAALLVPSGTQGNLICVLAQTRGGRSVIGEKDSHIFHSEDNNFVDFGHLRAIPIRGTRGVMNIADVQDQLEAVKDVDLVVLENTHNMAGGTIVPLENVREIKKISESHGAKLHIDGSRIFNAAAALNVGADKLVEPADTVMFCLSKGLCAPVGSMIAGSQEFIESARVWRRKLGGQMRQAGIIAAPGIIALKKMVGRLSEDHSKALYFAEELSDCDGLSIDMETVQTNIVMLDTSKTRVNAAQLVSRARESGIALLQFDDKIVRAVFYKDITQEDVELAIKTICKILAH